MTLPKQWFCALLETAADVYFRYSLVPTRRFAYVSPSVEALTGRSPRDFYADPDLCLSLIAGRDRRLLRRVLRSRRPVATRLHLVRPDVTNGVTADVAIPVELHTVALVKHGRVVAIEGLVRLAAPGQVGRLSSTGSLPARLPAVSAKAGVDAEAEPVQQRLAALMFEVHDLLHRMLPAAEQTTTAEGRRRVLRLGDLALDCDRLIVTESGEGVSLTSREVMVLRYLLERPGRIVTRERLLTDVWSYGYTGDDRTVDVHISRLRRKLPSLRGRLTAIRNIGYRLDDESDSQVFGARAAR